MGPYKAFFVIYKHVLGRGLKSLSTDGFKSKIVLHNINLLPSESNRQCHDPDSSGLKTLYC